MGPRFASEGPSAGLGGDRWAPARRRMPHRVSGQSSAAGGTLRPVAAVLSGSWPARSAAAAASFHASPRATGRLPSLAFGCRSAVGLRRYARL